MILDLTQPRMQAIGPGAYLWARAVVTGTGPSARLALQPKPVRLTTGRTALLVIEPVPGRARIRAAEGV